MGVYKPTYNWGGTTLQIPGIAGYENVIWWARKRQWCEHENEHENNPLSTQSTVNGRETFPDDPVMKSLIRKHLSGPY